MTEQITFPEILAQQPHNKGYAAPPVFQEGEKVFAFHQNMLYEAKILKVEMRNKVNSTRLGEREMYFFIHYQGWKTKWDEWVNDTRILKYTDQNRDFQRQMREMREGNRKKRSLRRLRDLTPPPTAKKPRKASTEGETDKIDALEALELPFVLQKFLADDYDFVNNQKNLVSLPAQLSVADILAAFADEKLQKNDKKFFNFTVLDEIRVLFDQSLGSLLLYRFERLQYQRMLENMKSKPTAQAFSQIYGAQHLLRLFYLLPNFVEEAALSDTKRNLILFYVSEILSYMEKNSGELFNPKVYAPVADDFVITL